MLLKAKRLMHEKLLPNDDPVLEDVTIIGFTEKTNGKPVTPSQTFAVYFNDKHQIYCDKLCYFTVIE